MEDDIKYIQYDGNPEINPCEFCYYISNGQCIAPNLKLNHCLDNELNGYWWVESETANLEII